MPELSGSSVPVVLAPGYVLDAPDLVGQVDIVGVAEHATRSDSGVHEVALADALVRAGMDTELMFEMEITDDLAPPASDTTRAAGTEAPTREGEPGIALTVPALEPDTGYAVLYTDEAGISRWILPEETLQEGEMGEVIFHLPRAGAPEPPATEEAEATRGPISKLGRRLVRVITWATDEIVGAGARAYARLWETDRRPYTFDLVGPGGATTPLVGNWDVVRGGRSLLLLHGTFSTAQAAFTHFFTSDRCEALRQHYGGRVFLFNHPSMHHGPTDNVREFLANAPGDLEVDIITHSRGGLVGRELVEQAALLQQGGGDLAVKKAIFVASPNQGTILADGDNWLDLVDRYTNLLTHLPDNIYTLSIEGILILVKLLAHGTLAGLPGLNCLPPKSPYLARLNSGPPHNSTYYALTADFTPTDPNLLVRWGKIATNRFIDHIFGAANDGVVPTVGCYEAGPSSYGFPIPPERHRVYQLDSRIHHSNYFVHDEVNRTIQEWLTGQV